jgi:PAX-interacting protein 1
LSVEQYGGEVEQSNTSRVTHVLCETQKFPEFQQVLKEGKRLVTLHWLSDICLRKCVTPPYYAIHLPVPFSENDRPLKGDQVAITGFAVEDRTRAKLMFKILGAEVNSHFVVNMKILLAHKPEGNKYQKAREWKIPVVNIQFLNELMFGLGALGFIHSPKYQHFNVDQPFRFDITPVAHLMSPWKSPIRVSAENFEKYKTRKRPLENKNENTTETKKPRLWGDENDFDDEPLTPPPVLAGDENDPTVQVKMEVDEDSLGEAKTKEKDEIVKDKKPVAVMISGFTREYKKKITEKIVSLGGRVTTDYRDATHLLMKESSRTKKLFVCLSRVRYIVTLNWLLDSLRNSKFVDAEPYIMSNELVEKTYGVKLRDLLAKTERHLLFANVTFYITPSCLPSVSDLQEIIESAGGQVDTKQRSLQNVRQQAIKSPRRYVIVTCLKDFPLIEKACMAQSSQGIHIHTPEFVLESITKQRFKPLKTLARLQTLQEKKALAQAQASSKNKKLL